MTEFLIAYTGPRGGKPKYETVTAETPSQAADLFLDLGPKEVYIKQVYAPVDLES